MTTTLMHYDHAHIRELLMGRRVRVVGNDRLVLDNGIALRIVPNEGCGGCSNGAYDIESLNGCDNAITSVEVTDDDLDGVDGRGHENEARRYSVFVFADNQRINLIEVEGTDGNGCYGTGFRIVVEADGVPTR